MEPKWLVWSRKLQALSQAGLTYSQNQFDLDRYRVIQSIAAEIAAEGSGIETSRVNDLFTGDEGYMTPKVDVRGAIFKDNRILLVRETMDNGRWTVPGGWVDPGDGPGQAAEREVYEETGYVVKANRLAAVYDRERHGHPAYVYSIIKLFFICDLIGGSPKESIETGESDFFNEDVLPELSIPRITVEEIHMLFQHHRHPELPTEFD
jgi:ADP-ribose pyrophosphatase YjhB (NUDIX family)